MTLSVNDNDLPLQRMYRWERERAGHIFLTQPFGGGKVREWNWAQAAAEVRRMAAYLKAQGWEPGSHVGILSKNCAWWIMADLAIWMAGHVTVPVYPSLKAQTVCQILEHSEARGCFIGAVDEKESATLGIPDGVTCIAFPTAPPTGCPAWEDVVASTPPLADNITRPAGDLATIIYTSGTTGVPKGVMHTFGAFTYLARTLADLIGLTPGQRVLSYLPLAHIVERGGMEMMSFLLGWHVFFAESVDTFLADLHRARPTLFLSVPRLLAKFQQGVFAKIPPEKLDRRLHVPLLNRYVKHKILHKLGLDTVHFAACGAAPLPPDLLLWYRHLGLELAEGYGMTESLITHLPKRGEVRPGYVGPAIPGVETKVGPGGELLVRSPMNMLGYYRDPQGTECAFTEDRFFHTGDVVQIAPDGQLKIIGRIKEQFKTSKGKYVAPAPIESRLIAHPAVEACCLMGAGEPSPFAVIVLSPEARQSCTDPAAKEALAHSLRTQMEHVNAELDPHERVRFIAVVEGPWTVSNGLITPTLKIRRMALEGRYQSLMDNWKRQDSPIVWESAS